MTALHIETPYFESQALTCHAGRAIWLKREALQPPGSFKIRGVGMACQTHAQRGVTASLAQMRQWADAATRCCRDLAVKALPETPAPVRV